MPYKLDDTINTTSSKYQKKIVDPFSRTKVFSARYAAERLATVCSSRHSSSRLLSCEDCDCDGHGDGNHDIDDHVDDHDDCEDHHEDQGDRDDRDSCDDQGGHDHRDQGGYEDPNHQDQKKRMTFILRYDETNAMRDTGGGAPPLPAKKKVRYFLYKHGPWVSKCCFCYC